MARGFLTLLLPSAFPAARQHLSDLIPGWDCVLLAAAAGGSRRGPLFSVGTFEEERPVVGCSPISLMKPRARWHSPWDACILLFLFPASEGRK